MHYNPKKILLFQILTERFHNPKVIFALLLFFVLLHTGCRDKAKETRTIKVHASAYNSHPSQTHHLHPSVAAWGDTLKPGMKAIAVSRDLLDSGLTHEKQVKISGLEGKYTVLDKMNRRWEKRIDIYMGNDRDSAINWGVKTVKITWNISENKD